jgi:ATP-binding cassette subfamily B protein
MDAMGSGKTLIATIHDFRWLSQFDWIVVLENGSVVGQGEHEELMKNCPLYVEMWELEKQIADDV